MELIKLKEEIKKVLSRKENKEGLHANKIAEIISNENINLFPDEDFTDIEKFQKRVNSVLYADVNRTDNAYQKVKNKNGSFKKGNYKLKPIRGNDSIPPPKPPNPPKESKKTDPRPDIIPIEPNSLFIGKAGECAVMSELLFRGYNANSMMVDDGIDVVASKNNLYYFIQVKTTVLNEKGRIYASIKKDRFVALINAQIRYIVVARCVISGLETNLYFVFNDQNIDEFIFDKVVNLNDSTISVKIKIDQNNGNKPFLYHDGKEKDITFFMNKFNL